MPVVLSGVMLGVARPPKGVLIISPPEKGAWPGPVWGNGKAEAYEAQTLAARVEALRHVLTNAAD